VKDITVLFFNAPLTSPTVQLMSLCIVGTLILIMATECHVFLKYGSKMKHLVKKSVVRF